MTQPPGRSSPSRPATRKPAAPSLGLPPGYPPRPTPHPRGRENRANSDRTYPAAEAPREDPQRLTLTGAGALLLLTLAGAAGATIDLLFGAGLETATMVLLPIGALAASWLVRRSALFWVLIAPPLVYLGVLAGSLLITTGALSLAALAAGLVYGFPTMAIASAVGVAVGALRQVTQR
ncbi:hypothetical protein BH18ACT7_BH18ACT7_25940 [soil metagenome]